MRAIAFAGALLASQAAIAADHDIAWFMAHKTARLATLQTCRGDHRHDLDIACMNAETAADRVWADRRMHRSNATEFQTPSYYAANDLSRLTTLAVCRQHPNGVFPPRVCSAAEAGDRMAGAQPR